MSEDQNLNENSLLEPLINTKLWVRICSIAGFVSSGFMVIAAVFLMFMGGAMTESGAGMPAGFGFGLGVVYLLIALLYLMPSLYLHKYAGAITTAQESNSIDDIKVALEYQKSFWKFVGILTLVMLVIAGIGIIAAVLIPMMAM